MIVMLRRVVAVLITTVPLIATAQGVVERGRDLVNGIMACGNCHTPRGPDGRLLPGRELAGGAELIEEPVFIARAPNLTPDPETGLGRWSDAEIARAIREGVRPDGRIIGPPMQIGRAHV